MYQRIQSLLANAAADSSGRMFNTAAGVVLGWGTTVGNGVEGWAPGAFFVHTDGSGDTLLYRNTGTSSSATWTKLTLSVTDSVTAGTVSASKAVVVDSNKDIGDFRNVDITCLQVLAGAAAAAAGVRFGATATEGLEIKAIDEDVTLTNAVEVDLTETVPAGAVILSVQGNLETAITGDGSGDNGLTKVGIGVTADPDKYGKTSGLTKNLKIDTIPDWTVLASEETVTVKACDNDGAAVTEKFTAGGIVRVRIVYAACNSLDDAA